MTDIFKSDDKTGSTDTTVTTETTVDNKIDVDVIKKRLDDSQVHIKTIEAENASLKKELEKAKTIDDVLEKMKSGQAMSESDTGVKDIPDLDAMIDERLSRKEQEAKNLKQQQTLLDNGKSVAAALRESYGDKAEETFNKKAIEMGESVEDLHILAKSKPNLVLKMFGLDVTKSVGTQTHASGMSVNTEAVINNNQSSNTKMTELTKQFFNDPHSSAATFAALEKEHMSRLKDK